ncbi:MAG TPA: hypothetical protein VJR25_14590, partial [Microbacterium sp.]|uniref:hypothetical protein n=1 Tax=Microbacterium sp. TaxID=51671 RepID=UPI002B48324E
MLTPPVAPRGSASDRDETGFPSRTDARFDSLLSLNDRGVLNDREVLKTRVADGLADVADELVTLSNELHADPELG